MVKKGGNVTKKEKVDLSIISPVWNKAPFLKGFLHSLLEQDIWERMELIWVENGSKDKSWEEMNNLVNKLGKKRKENIKLVQLKEANRCSAINEGVKHATGRYWSFLPSDAALFPGAARTWVESLDEFPEYGFLYGGYRFAPPHGGVFMSEKFDAEMLKQYNYVDGSFPIKKGLYPYFNNGGHDPNIKSLNDWDFWLAVIMGKDKKGSGVKGLYRPEVFFETIPPQAGGLSDDSNKNWVERTGQIKKKWGINEGDICVTAPGAPFHAKNIAKILKQEFRHMPSFKPHNFKMIYLLGFYPQMAEQCAGVFATQGGKLTSGTKVIHWIGSDIWGMLNSKVLDVKKLKDQFAANNFIHLVEFEQTRDELRDLGIEAKIVPLPPARLYEPMPLPKKFTVAVYMPDQNQEFYYKDLMEEVAFAMPDIDFLFFGNRFDLSKNKNIQHVGYIDDMEKLLKECSAIVRLTAHDGMPLSLAEFVMAGRNALFNIKIPHMVYLNSNNKELIIQRIRDLQKLPLNVEGSKYYRKLLDHDKFRATIEALKDTSGYDPESYWQARADSWEQQAGHNVMPFEKEIKKVLNRIEYESVLDIGCGNGRYVDMFKGKKYAGFDISTKLVSFAKQFYPQCKFAVGDVRSFMTGEVVYDLGFSFTTLQHVSPKDLGLAADRIKRACKTFVLIESQGFKSADYCSDHDYSKHFNIIRTEKLPKDPIWNPNSTLELMVIDNK
jgi:glycosyltransferase involved in cell wall biosynthesis